MPKGAGSGRDSASASTSQAPQNAVGIARLEGQVEALQIQLAALEATDEQRRAELASTVSELAEAQARVRELQARLEERRQLVEELRDRLKVAEATTARAEQERAAVIACLGWRAKRRLNAAGG